MERLYTNYRVSIIEAHRAVRCVFHYFGSDGSDKQNEFRHKHNSRSVKGRVD